MNQENVKSGFEKCGIYQFNPEKVYARLPDYDEVNQEPINIDVQVSWSNTSKNHGTCVSQNYEKKITVTPGQPAQLGDFEASFIRR